MANVSVYNIEGKEVGSIELNDAVFGVEVNEHLVHMAQRHVQKFLVAEENLGDRRELVMQDRVLQELHSGQAAVSYLHQSQEIIHSR